MDWIKRNLYFCIGSLVALVLMGMAVFYLYSKWQENAQTLEKLNEDYAELQRLNQQNPHPGSGSVDNIRAARQQQEQVAQQTVKLRDYFQRIPAEPDSTNVTSQEFSAALRQTIDQLQRRATNASVTLPSDGTADSSYSFSFTAQKNRVTFAPGSLGPLAVQLGEVKAICNVLFEAGINSLDNIRRERVSPDDASGPQTDYHLKKSVTNEWAILTPYEVTFRAFSQELADALVGFAASPNGFLVKTINVDPASSGPSEEGMPGMYGYGQPAPYFAPGPITTPSPTMPGAEGEMSAAYRNRYGIGGGASRRMGAEGPMGGGRGGISLRPLVPGQPTPPPVAPTYTPGYAPGQFPPGTGVPGRGGLPTVLDEKQVKVTLQIDVVKLLPPK